MKVNILLFVIVLFAGCSTTPTSYIPDTKSNYEYAVDALNRNNYEAAYRLLESYYDPQNNSDQSVSKFKFKADALFINEPLLLNAGLSSFSEISFNKTLERHRGDKTKAVNEEMNRLAALKLISPKSHKIALDNFVSFFGNTPEFFIEENKKRREIDIADLNRERKYSVLKERLRNAQITTKRMENGATFTNVKFAGSLQPNHTLECVSIKEVSSEYNPPSLVYAAKKCIQQNQHKKAWELLTTATGYAYYDIKRLADRSTRGARTVLMINALSDIDKQKMETTQNASKEIQADTKQVKAYCAELKRIGPPTYEPQWAILHGIGVYDTPRNGHYLTNIDTAALWDEILRTRCTPIKPKNP